MTDIRLKQVVTDLPVVAVSFDWLMTPLGTFDTSQELATAVTVALGTDRLADPDDILPGFDETDRRGWWGDLEAELLHDGWPIGSKLWLLTRHKITGSVARQGSSVARAQQYVFEALQPFVDRRICSSVEVIAVRVGTDRIDVDVVMYRGPQPALALRYNSLWKEIEVLATLPTSVGPYGV
jgi:phage gp46-like protein